MEKEVKIVHDQLRAAFKAKRLGKGLSIRQLAALANVEANLVDEFERTGRDIRTSKLIALTLALEIDLFKDLK